MTRNRKNIMTRNFIEKKMVSWPNRVSLSEWKITTRCGKTHIGKNGLCVFCIVHVYQLCVFSEPKKITRFGKTRSLENGLLTMSRQSNRSVVIFERCVCAYGIYMCMYIYMYMCVYAYVYTYIHMYMYIHICVYTYIYLCMSMNIYMRQYICKYIHIFLNVLICTYIYIYTCIYINICIYAHKCARTHSYIYLHIYICICICTSAHTPYIEIAQGACVPDVRVFACVSVWSFCAFVWVCVRVRMCNREKRAEKEREK